MRPFGKTIPITEALSLAEQASVPLARTEQVDLDNALGRVLARGEARQRPV